MVSGSPLVALDPAAPLPAVDPGGPLAASMGAPSPPEMQAALACADTDPTDSGGGSASVPMGIAKIGQMLLNKGSCGSMGISQYRLAVAIKVDPRRISEIVQAKRAVSADTALRLGIFFGVEPQIWLNLQARYDLERTARDHGQELAEEVRPWRGTGS